MRARHIVEFGILLDVLAGVMIMAVILQNIKQTFDDVDTALLANPKGIGGHFMVEIVFLIPFLTGAAAFFSAGKNRKMPAGRHRRCSPGPLRDGLGRQPGPEFSGLFCGNARRTACPCW
jgi:hypothetical protein